MIKKIVSFKECEESIFNKICFVEKTNKALEWLINKSSSPVRDFMHSVHMMVNFCIKKWNGSFAALNNLKAIIDKFERYVVVEEYDFGVLKCAAEYESFAFMDLIELDSVKRTINHRYRKYNGAPIICMWHLLSGTIPQDKFFMECVRHGSRLDVVNASGENALAYQLHSRPHIVTFRIYICSNKK